MVYAAASLMSQTATKPGTCQMFETPLIERFSRVSPVAPFVFWLPVLAYFAYSAVALRLGGASEASLLGGLGIFLLGLLAWTFTEYVLHRWVFHYMGARPWQRRMFFVIHGVHHDFPNDADRLVMPLGASIPMGVIFYTVFYVALGRAVADPLFVGFALGYLIYDGMHYAIHHLTVPTRAGKWIKRHHIVHHFTGEDARYGVSNPLWDIIFGTMGSKKVKTSSL